jgi:Molybdenum cofactor biosynthesis enzyme
MPEEGIHLLRHEDILTFDEIAGFTEVAVRNGITKVRLTGGEPLVRKGIVTLVNMIARIEGIEDLSMTTNGVLLKEYAVDLKKAGLHRVNISLDTADPARFSQITRGGNLADVMNGIKSAKDAGLLPVKINCVIIDSPEEEDARNVTEFCKENQLEIRYIYQMDLVRGHFSTIVGGIGGNCALCNRLRLTSDGKLRPCLFNDLAFDIREMGFEDAIKKAVDLKPECGSNNLSGEFYNIGG